ncbi:hypothetical protein A1O1_00108 [Capronia coronata CBS 617.96]|uniref:Arrestin C-terminal-like domain-containing protein n=1 Tax=Capronia coronata CBS 617.96 TaxID=1182541 RepID=W9YZ86_9EURO|nr:uncharacterized protein A1O1_00108 [Capronia coronata CBS 617.96]EXJ94990.1 hypothetical protein A1O1_00108 [Capronia coronata CBS 617.96]
MKFPIHSSLEAFTRPISALARHRIHQLSDIREVSGSSRAATVGNTGVEWSDGTKDRPQTPALPSDALSHTTSSEYLTPTAFRSGCKANSSVLGSRTASAISLPQRHVPERRSSASIFSRGLRPSGQVSMQEMPTWGMPELDDNCKVVPDRGRAESPVRQAIGRSAQSSEILRPSAARTFIRTSPPHELLDNGSSRHPRVELSVRLPSPLFVGGGTVEGQIAVQVDGGGTRKSKLKPIHVSKASVDVIGVEEISDGRRWVFLSLATELFDSDNLPPPSLVTSQRPLPGPELWWELKASTSVLPFCVNLPLKLGPPPYASRQASIRYLLCPSVVIRVGDKRSVVRQTWNVQMLTVHDPEKALASLPSPLLAADTLYLTREPEIQTVKLTAGLHRQTWVNGAAIFIDIHVLNNSTKSIKKIEVQLEKTTLWYTHAPAGTVEKTANHLRLPRRTDTEIVSGSALKRGSAWNGILSHSSEVRTIELEAPRGHVTISTGRYFEVRYFVNVVVTVKMFKTVAVQLPVTLIPINSLDILPNSLAQVAASIEAKREKTVPALADGPGHEAYHQGQAFTAPLRRSMEQQRERAAMLPNDEHTLQEDIDSSPRRRGHIHHHSRGGPDSEVTDENTAPGRPSMASSSHHHVTRHPSCYHCHLAFEQQDSGRQEGPRLPRLQVSTSGLGFSESEFEVPADSPPRKVMLSERERNMINQQRELRNRQQRSNRKQKRPSSEIARGHAPRRSQDQASWNNVVADSATGPKQPDFGNVSALGVHPQRTSVGMNPSDFQARGGGAARSRSKTNPEGPKRLQGANRPRRRSSTDRLDRVRVTVDAAPFSGAPRRTSKGVGYRGSLDQLF